MNIKLLQHPLSDHLLTILRDETTTTAAFRAAAGRVTTLLAIEATRDMPTTPQNIRTPLEEMQGATLAQQIVVVPVLRAGLGMLTPFVELFPDVAVGYIGLARDEETAVAVTYYRKLPPLAGRRTILVDPMLATGGSAVQALDALKAAGADDIQLVCIVAAPEGVAQIHQNHPDVPLLAAALDRELDDRRYICPGLGDFGDRLYGT
jgi:uracil phosphoribosyltransferase